MNNIKILIFDLFHSNDLFLNPLKMSENQRFSVFFFREYRKRQVVWNGLTAEHLRQLSLITLFVIVIINKSEKIIFHSELIIIMLKILC